MPSGAASVTCWVITPATHSRRSKLREERQVSLAGSSHRRLTVAAPSPVRSGKCHLPGHHIGDSQSPLQAP
jgi:hypothetical protein